MHLRPPLHLELVPCHGDTLERGRVSWPAPVRTDPQAWARSPWPASTWPDRGRPARPSAKWRGRGRSSASSAPACLEHCGRTGSSCARPDRRQPKHAGKAARRPKACRPCLCPWPREPWCRSACPYHILRITYHRLSHMAEAMHENKR
jgi:hypothetical protein